MSLKKILCKVLGHIPIGLNVNLREATCARCEALLNVSYDGMYGTTVVEGVKNDR